MKSLNTHYIVKVICCGFIVFLVWSVFLYWGRFLCEAALLGLLPYEARKVTTRPSGLVPEKYENDPNVAKHSELKAVITDKAPLLYPGIFKNILPGIGVHPSSIYNGSNIYRYETHDNGNGELIYFEEESGLIRYRIFFTDEADKESAKEPIDYYIGPDGMSQSPEKELGRFFKLLAGHYGYFKWMVFDKKQRKFFKINFHNKTVLKGPELAKDDSHQPAQIMSLLKNWGYAYTNFQSPQVKKEKVGHTGVGYQEYKPIVNIRDWGPYALVLDKTGEIYLLDKQTLEFAGKAGCLPAPYGLFVRREKVSTEELLCYIVKPYFLYQEDTHKREYLGLFAAAVNREGTSLSLAVYNSRGELIERRDTRLGRDTPKFYDGAEHYQHFAPAGPPTSEAVYFGSPWAPALTIGKYVLENLHPFGLNVVSYFTAGLIEAESGHRAIFLLPNSFIAMKAAEQTDEYTGKVLGAWLILLPSLALSLLLAWRVSKNANLMGLSENTRLCWLIGTITFGLSAYITYHLTKPVIKQVTCENCGRMRRPDMELCQHCGSKWEVPELEPPDWRVIEQKTSVTRK